MQIGKTSAKNESKSMDNNNSSNGNFEQHAANCTEKPSFIWLMYTMHTELLCYTPMEDNVEIIKVYLGVDVSVSHRDTM